MTKYFVTATDKCLSGWGRAEKKRSMFILVADGLQEAEIVAENMRNRSDMSRVRINLNPPTGFKTAQKKAEKPDYIEWETKTAHYAVRNRNSAGRHYEKGGF